MAVDKKKKILIVNDLIQGGGVEKLMYDLVTHWNDKYHITIMTYEYFEIEKTLYPENVDYLCPSPKKEYKNSFLLLKILNKIHRKVFKKVFDWKFARKNFDIVIAMKDGWILKEVSKMDIPIKLGWVHTDYNNYYYTYDLFCGPINERKCMQQFKTIVCVAETIKQGLIDTIGDPGNLCVKYNPIDVDLILDSAQEPVVDVDTKFLPNVTRFVTVGRLNYQKGYDLLLEACHILEQEGLNFEVWIIGGEEPWGDEHNRLYRAKNRLKLKSINFLGGRKNPYKYMKYADWFLSSSIFEGYSLVSQEAAVLDIPLILTDCSGVRELLGDSEYGIVMGISVRDIYINMKRVIEHPELHEYYREKNMKRKEVIDFESRIKEIEKLLK